MKLRSFEDRVMALQPRKENLEDVDDGQYVDSDGAVSGGDGGD